MTLIEPNNASGAGPSPDSDVALAIPDRNSYSVKLPIFEGPLDLLLHLIRQNEVEITDIPVALISAQYLEYLELMRALDLDVAGDYLVMAATLALIKSRMLLPPDQEDEEGEVIDPRAELMARLLEYQRYKEVAEELGKRRMLGRDVFPAQGAGPDRTPDAEREIAVDLYQLVEAFRQILASARPTSIHHVETETVRVRDQMLSIMTTLQKVRSIEFMQLFEPEGGEAPSRPMVVATFLAILELARLHGLHLYQGLNDDGAPEGVIRLRVGDDIDEHDWEEALSEQM